MDDQKFSKEDVDYIMNVLRLGTVTWSGRQECLRLARKKVFERRAKNGKPVYKLKWQCATCSQWFRNEDDMQVDHIVEIGGYNGNFHDMIFKMYRRPVEEHLQCLCKWCHMKKTMKYNSAKTLWKRKSAED